SATSRRRSGRSPSGSADPPRNQSWSCICKTAATFMHLPHPSRLRRSAPSATTSSNTEVGPTSQRRAKAILMADSRGSHWAPLTIPLAPPDPSLWAAEPVRHQPRLRPRNGMSELPELSLDGLLVFGAAGLAVGLLGLLVGWRQGRGPTGPGLAPALLALTGLGVCAT